MLAYKALYKKMMDDLKDAGMWLDWAEQICGDHPNEAKFLLESAKERLDESFPETYEIFTKLCSESHVKGEVCLNEIVHDHIMDWHHSMKMRTDNLLSKW